MKQGWLMLIAFVSLGCNGQTAPLTQAATGETRTVSGQTKLVKTQGAAPFNNVHGGLQDKAGNLWFVTTGEGVYRYDGTTFTNFTTKDGLNHNTVFAVAEDKNGTLWFGTADGVCRYDGRTFSRLRFPFENIYQPTRMTGVLSMLADKSGNLWVGTDRSGVFRYDGVVFADFLTGETVQCIYEDRVGNIWFGSWSQGGAYRFDGRTFTHFTPAQGLSDNMVSHFAEDRAGNILMSTRDSGFCSYDGSVFTHYRMKDGLCTDNIFTMLTDKDGRIWTGHCGKNGDNGAGLCRYDGKSFVSFRIGDGVVNNDIFFMMEDRSGDIWIGTRDVGLYRFDGKTFTDFTER